MILHCDTVFIVKLEGGKKCWFDTEAALTSTETLTFVNDRLLLELLFTKQYCSFFAENLRDEARGAS
jgi:hypothetical protein